MSKPNNTPSSRKQQPMNNEPVRGMSLTRRGKIVRDIAATVTAAAALFGGIHYVGETSEVAKATAVVVPGDSYTSALERAKDTMIATALAEKDYQETANVASAPFVSGSTSLDLERQRVGELSIHPGDAITATVTRNHFGREFVDATVLPPPTENGTESK